MVVAEASAEAESAAIPMPVSAAGDVTSVEVSVVVVVSAGFEQAAAVKHSAAAARGRSLVAIFFTWRSLLTKT